MPRVKRGTSHVKRRKNLLKKVKGFKWGRKNLMKRAKEATLKAGAHAYADRRKKKSTSRALWHIKIGAFVREEGISYSKFIGALKKNNIQVDKKIMADLAVNNKTVMRQIVEKVK